YRQQAMPPHIQWSDAPVVHNGHSAWASEVSLNGQVVARSVALSESAAQNEYAQQHPLGQTYLTPNRTPYASTHTSDPSEPPALAQFPYASNQFFPSPATINPVLTQFPSDERDVPFNLAPSYPSTRPGNVPMSWPVTPPLHAMRVSFAEPEPDPGRIDVDNRVGVSQERVIRATKKAKEQCPFCFKWLDPKPSNWK
ncbi:hypothetical protein FRC11_000880, partial [Ceratobasidium sp. 423]